MPKTTRKDLINNINKSRSDNKAHLLYVKGLTKMKKKELNEIYDELENMSNRTENPEDLAIQNELQQQIDDIKNEILALDQERVKLDELTSDDEEEQPEEQPEEEQSEEEQPEEEQLEEEQLEEEQPEEQPEEQLEEEQLEDYEEENKYSDEELVDVEELLNKYVKEVKPNKSIKSYEKEIKTMLKEYKNIIHDILMEFDDKDVLDKNDINEIVDFYKEQTEIINHNLEIIYENLPKNKDFSDDFYEYIENILIAQECKVNDFIQ